MPISTDGFLASEISNWVTVHRKRNAEWFSLADDLNRLAYELRVEIEKLNELERWKFVVCALFMKAHESFQAAVILCERGLTGDAKNVIRSAFETLFCLGACSADNNVIEKLANAEMHYKKKMARALLDLPADLGLETADAEKMKQFLADNPERAEGLKVWQMASQAGLEQVYNVYYRSLSHEATHPSVSSLERFVAQDETDIRGFRHGPDVADVGYVVATACVVAFYIINAMTDKFVLPAVAEKLAAKFKEFSQLLDKTFPGRPQSLG